jgi:hypothetical protein
MASPDHAQLLEQAEEKRRGMIRRLAMCRCAYPLERYRNGSGHATSCPVHQERLAALHGERGDDG